MVTKRSKREGEKKTKKPLISMIIPFRSNIDQVRECVDSLKKQRYKKFEIVLVSDKVKWKDKDKRVKAVHNPKFRGVGEKRNAGVRRAKGDIYFFLDSDCVVKPNTLTELVKLFNTIETDAISGKPLAPKKGNLLGIATGLEYEDRFNRMGENFVDIAATTCFAVRKGAFKAMGGFKDYSLGEATGEDWDLSKRFTVAGFKIFHTNKVQVYHNHKSDSIKKWFMRRVQHSGYRITHRRKYGEVFEQYFSPRMVIDTSGLLCVPVTLRMYKESKRAEVFALPVFAFLRNIAWFIGITRELVTK
jgi:GT2 family glycosyltransferase